MPGLETLDGARDGSTTGAIGSHHVDSDIRTRRDGFGSGIEPTARVKHCITAFDEVGGIISNGDMHLQHFEIITGTDADEVPSLPVVCGEVYVIDGGGAVITQ